LNQKVKLLIRPLGKGKRRWIEASKTNSRHDDTVFFLRWLPQGAKNYKYESIGKVTWAAGRIRRASKELEISQDGGAGLPPTLSQPKTLEEFRTEFLRDKETTFKKDGTPQDSETIRCYGLATREFLDIVKRTQPDQITKQDMKDWITKLRQRLCHRSVCNLYIQIACFLKFCGIDHKTLLPQSERPTPVMEIPEAYTEEEIKNFFFYVVNERDALAFEFLLKTGARKDEMAFLDWHNNLNLGASPTVKFITKEDFRVKTGKSRVVPLERELAAKLRAWREKNPSTRLVFGTKFDTPEGNFLRACKKVAQRAGMDHKTFWLHKFRDTFATWSLRRGRDIRTVQHWLGHADISMTQKYLAPEEGEQAQNQINTTFGGTVVSVVTA
jgi:integrase